MSLFAIFLIASFIENIRVHLDDIFFEVLLVSSFPFRFFRFFFPDLFLSSSFSFSRQS